MGWTPSWHPRIARLLRRGLHRPDLGLSIVYSNPTVAQLSEVLTAQRKESPDDDSLLMELMVSTFRSLPQQIENPESLPVARRSINEPVAGVLTGSTGT